MYKIRYLHSAIQDMQEIFSFIAQDNLQNAGKVVLSIKTSIENLSIFPFLGRQLTMENRLLIEPKYKYSILYRVEWKSIFIISIDKKKQ